MATLKSMSDWPLGPPCDLMGVRHRAMVSSGHQVRFNLAVTNTPHRHLRFHELCLVTAGHGEYVHGGDSFDLEPGHVFLADPGITHEISSRKTRDLSLRFWEVSFSTSPTAMATTGLDPLLDAFHRGHRITAKPTVNLLPCLELLPSSPVRYDASVRAVETLFLEMILALAVDPPVVSGKATPADDAVDRVIAHVRAHPTAVLSGQNLARHVGMSERNLRLRIRKALGKSLHQVVTEQRLSLAAMLLGQHFRVGEVCRMVGVEDAGQFTRMFTRHFSVAPKAFQVKHYGDDAIPYTRHGS